MGGRGASSGISDKGKVYGTEYSTLLKSENIKFVKYIDSKSAKTPQETMTKDRVYVTVNENGDLKAVTYYDKSGKRTKQIDISGKPHKIDGKLVLPHVHYGYVHDEKGTFKPSKGERDIIDKVIQLWNNKRKR